MAEVVHGLQFSNHFIECVFPLSVIHFFCGLFSLFSQLLHQWEQTACAKVVVKAPDEATL